MKSLDLKQILFVLTSLFLVFCLFACVVPYFFSVDKMQYANSQDLTKSLKNPMFMSCGQGNLLSKAEISNFKEFVIGVAPSSTSGRKTSVQDQTVKCTTHYFGTDKLGRDIYSRIIVGIRYTMVVSSTAVLFSLFLGITIGAMAGYYGGKTDRFLSMLISLFWSLPSILLAFAISFAFGRTLPALFIAIGLTMWGDVARVVRGQVKYFKEMYFVQAGISMGFSDSRILFRHILPNIMGPIYVLAASNFALAVLLESGLSFIGLGLQPPIPTLGNILQEHYVYAVSSNPLLAIIPAFIVVLLILSFQLQTNYWRDKTDLKATTT